MTRSVNDFITWYYLNSVPSDESILTIAEELAEEAAMEHSLYPKVDLNDQYEVDRYAIHSDLPLTEIMHLR